MNSRYERVLNGAAIWAAYYRANPDKFVKDYLHINLRLFQKILIVMMNISAVFVYIASRGQGKTFLCAIFCCFRAILYPGTKICIASGTRGQAKNVLDKILTELKPKSAELANEIDEKGSKMNGTDAIIMFKNGSFIKVVTAGESARGNRAHVLILDEFRLIPKDTIDTILKRFLSSAREPNYSELTEKEKLAEREKERNRTLYFSSAYYQDHWSYEKCLDTLRRMRHSCEDGFVCGLPWQLAVEEHLLRLDDVYADMSESDFTEIKWAMEMDAIFWGSGDGSFFDSATISKDRRIKYPMLPGSLASKLNNSQLVRILPKQNGEVRILSCDIALMSSRKNRNDATAIFINQMLPTKAGRYTNNIVYCDAMEGLHTEDQALVIRKLFDEFDCDYIVLDTNGLGLGVYDSLVRDISDTATGELYPALSCCNDQTMADRCTSVGAAKVIWSVKATPTFNSDCAVLLREGFRSGRVRLLTDELEAESSYSEIKGYSNLNPAEKQLLKMPYVHTDLLITELTKLQHDESGGKVKIFEKAGMRKDRYSSLAYNFYIATLLEAKITKRSNYSLSEKDAFVIRAPNYKRKAVSKLSGRIGTPGWC